MFKIGDTIFHEKFGEGIIEKTHQETCDVAFVVYGKKCIKKDFLFISPDSTKKPNNESTRKAPPIIISGRETEKALISKKMRCLKEALDKDIYTVSTFYGKLRQIGFNRNDIKKYQLISKNGFYRVGKEILLSGNFKNPKEYLLFLMKDENLYRPSGLVLKKPLYDSLIELMNENIILEIEEGLLLTPKRMIELGIYDEIQQYKKGLDSMFNERGYFTTKKIENLKPDFDIFKRGFDEYTIDKMTSRFPGIGMISVSNIFVFYYKKTKVNTRVDLFLCYYNDRDSAYAFDIAEEINGDLGIEYTELMASCDARSAGLYYNQTSEKIYKNKTVFIKEVYGDGV